MFNSNQSNLGLLKQDTTNPSWLTQQLRRAGMLDKNHFIQSTQSKTIAEELGFLSETKVINLNYNQDQPHLIQQLLIKELTQNEQFQAMEKSFNGFEREILFYQNLAPSVPIRLPHIYFTQLNKNGKLLAMEYLSSLQCADQVKGLTHRQVQNVIENIGKLHAHFWQDESLKSLSWLLSGGGQIIKSFTGNWHDYAVTATPIIGNEGVKMFQQIETKFNWILEQIENSPYTLVHMDLRADNILLNPTNEKEPVFVDWQVATRSMGAFDVARVVGGSEINNQRKGHQLELVRLWHQVLVDNGVRNYSLDDAWFHFKLASLFWLVNAVCLYGCSQDNMSHGGRIASLFSKMVQRCFNNVIETSAMDILK